VSGLLSGDACASDTGGGGDDDVVFQRRVDHRSGRRGRRRRGVGDGRAPDDRVGRRRQLDGVARLGAGGRRGQVRGVLGGGVAVEVLAADEPAVAAPSRELVAGVEAAPACHAAETVDVVDALACAHHQVDAVETQTAAAALHAEQPAAYAQHPPYARP